MAREQWCTDNPTECVMSEPFQSTSYTRTDSGSNYALFSGDQTDLLGLVNQPAAGACSISAQDTGSSTFAGNYDISTDSTILNLLPNRDVSKVARFLYALETFGQWGAHRFGYAPMTLGTTKRFALRWYSYHTSNYQWAQDGACTNGKIAHISQSSWGSDPFLTLTHVSSNSTQVYSFLNAGWHWTGHASFEGFFSAPRPGAGMQVSDMRGKWFRHEIVARRPRTADSNTGGLGFDYSYFVKNITDGTAEIEDQRFSSGCSGCMAIDDPFTWNTGVYPSSDLTSVHTEFYREGDCLGRQGWLYAVVAKWTTDAGQRIGAASEVEGGSGPVAGATYGLRPSIMM